MKILVICGIFFVFKIRRSVKWKNVFLEGENIFLESGDG